jgi:hypothetical protein
LVLISSKDEADFVTVVEDERASNQEPAVAGLFQRDRVANPVAERLQNHGDIF